MPIVNEFILALQEAADPSRIEGATRFFGQYGEIDIFWGITVPKQRIIAKKFMKLLSLSDMKELMQHEVHEVRLSTLMLMVYRYERSKEEREALAQLYMQLFQRINNWDLVDCSAHHILGAWFYGKDTKPLYDMAASDHLWTVRIAMISTFYFIRQGDFQLTMDFATMLLKHPHHLIHKAVGWMLREMGERDFEVEKAWLQKHYQQMPRTMLRYAIEKFPEELRQDFLKGRV